MNNENMETFPQETSENVEQQQQEQTQEQQKETPKQDNNTILLINNINNRIDALNQKIAFLEANQTKQTIIQNDEPLKGV